MQENLVYAGGRDLPTWPFQCGGFLPLAKTTIVSLFKVSSRDCRRSSLLFAECVCELKLLPEESYMSQLCDRPSPPSPARHRIVPEYKIWCLFLASRNVLNLCYALAACARLGDQHLDDDLATCSLLRAPLSSSTAVTSFIPLPSFGINIPLCGPARCQYAAKPRQNEPCETSWRSGFGDDARMRMGALIWKVPAPITHMHWLSAHLHLMEDICIACCPVWSSVSRRDG
jgi:hypothetical protein